MAIAFGSVGANSQGTSSVTPGAPASLANGDIVLIFVSNKADTVTPSTPAGWTLVGTVAGGGGTNANDTGPVRTTCFSRVKDASWSAMPAITLTSGDSNVAVAVRYTKAAGVNWDVAATSGVDSTANTAFSITGGANPGITANDMLVVGAAVTSDTPTWATQTLTATGATIGTRTERAEPKTTNGWDLGGCIWDAPVSSGTATAAPIAGATLSTATGSTGSGIIVRLREVSAPAFSGSVSLSGDGTLGRTGVPGHQGTLSTLSGDGTLGCSGQVLGYAGPVALSGDGTLGRSSSLMGVTAPVALSGDSVHSRSASLMSHAGSAGLSGSGTLSFAAVVGVSRTLARTGDGDQTAATYTRRLNHGMTSNSVAPNMTGGSNTPQHMDRTSNGVLWWATGSSNANGGGFDLGYAQENSDVFTKIDTSWTYGQVAYINGVSFFIDSDDYMHLVYEKYEGAGDGRTFRASVQYRLGTPNAARTNYTFGTPFTVVGSDYWHKVSVVAHPSMAGGGARTVHIALGYNWAGDNRQILVYTRLNVTSTGVVSMEAQPSLHDVSGSDTDTVKPVIAFRHTGDGKTPHPTNPNLAIAYQLGPTWRIMYGTYGAGTWSWSASFLIDNNHPRTSAATPENITVYEHHRWHRVLWDAKFNKWIVLGVVADSAFANQYVWIHEVDHGGGDSRNWPQTSGTQTMYSGNATLAPNGDLYVAGVTAWAPPNSNLVLHLVVRSTISSARAYSVVQTVETGGIDGSGPMVDMPMYSGSRIFMGYSISNVIGTARYAPPAVAYDGFVNLSGDGSLSFAALPRPTGSVTLSGEGTITGTGRPSTAGNAGLSGSGTLTFSAVVNVSGSAGLSGSGTVSGTGLPGFAGSTGLSGSGTLTGSGVPRPTGAVALSGSGTLSGSGRPGVSGSTGLSGVGTLSGSGSPGHVGAASLSGNGTLGLSGVGQEQVYRSIALSGDGALAFTTVVSASGSVALSGDGTMSGTGRVNVTGSVGLSGTGTLTGSGRPGAVQAVALSGSGTVTGSGTPHPRQTVGLSGSGTVAGSQAAMTVAGSVALSGSGTITGSAVVATSGSTVLSGSGSWSATAQSVTVAGTAPLTGSGTLTGSGLPGAQGSLSRTGDGSLAFVGAPRQVSTLAGSGSGSLAGTGAPAPRNTIPVSGAGTLSASSGALAASGSVALSGAGTLSGSGSPTASGSVALSGSGTVSAAGSNPAITQSLALSGSGTKTRQAVSVGLAGSGATSGAGTLLVSGNASQEGAASVSFSGNGTLSLAGKPSAGATLGYTGTGSLSSAGRPTVSQTRALSGSGQVVAAATGTHASGSVALSGSGAVGTAALVAVSGQVERDGLGTLELLGVAQYRGSLDLSGDSDLLLFQSPFREGALEFSGSGQLARDGTPFRVDFTKFAEGKMRPNTTRAKIWDNESNAELEPTRSFAVMMETP